MTFALRITYKSNLLPWTSGYEPLAAHQPMDEEAARRWACGIQDGMGGDYIVVLMLDGRQIADCSVDRMDIDVGEGETPC